MEGGNKATSKAAAAPAEKTRGPRPESSLAKLYKLAYNAGMCGGWGLVGLMLAKYYVDTLPLGTAHKNAEAPLLSYIMVPLVVFQTGAVLEVAHVLLGLVRAPLGTTIIQVASRLMLLWGVVLSVPQINDHLFLATMVASWTVTEVVRYGYYVFNLLGWVPYPLLWLRYTLFYFLYPSGAGSEFLLLIKALPYVHASRMYSVFMPNQLNFMFDYYWFLILTAAVYVPGFPEMYTHMISQRRRYLH
jgi:very-long-chain (3R)-3-hydroxyacyl-CoA dehydratase